MTSDTSARQTTVYRTGEQLAEDHASGGDAQLRRQIRELVSDLIRDVLRAMATASVAELGHVARGLEQDRARTAPAHAAPRRRMATRTIASPTPQRTAIGGERPENRRDAVSSPSSPPQDERFDITSPGALLGSTDELAAQPTPAERSQHEPHEKPAPQTPESNPAREPAQVLVANDKEAASERRPTVVLREGERLLSATGSGVVIRRERRLSPPR
jgi:hypothetical protein